MILCDLFCLDISLAKISKNVNMNNTSV